MSVPGKDKKNKNRRMIPRTGGRRPKGFAITVGAVLSATGLAAKGVLYTVHHVPPDHPARDWIIQLSVVVAVGIGLGLRWLAWKLLRRRDRSQYEEDRAAVIRAATTSIAELTRHLRRKDIPPVIREFMDGSIIYYERARALALASQHPNRDWEKVGPPPVPPAMPLFPKLLH